MKIPDAYAKIAPTAPTESVRRLSAAKSAGSRDVSHGDAVKVSVSAAAQALATQAGGIDEAKVAKLKSAIESGSFHVDARGIADTLVNGD